MRATGYLRCADCERILGGREGPTLCDPCADSRGDLAETRYFDAVDAAYLDAAVRSDVEGAECVFCPALTSAPDGLCASCRDGWGQSERAHPSNPRFVPDRDPNHATGDLT